jgi:thiamine transport system substrate-binding protein
VHNTKSIFKRAFAALAIVATTAAALTGCSAPTTKAVAVASHDSFIIPDNLINQFKTETGFYLEGGAKLGDAGTLTNKLVLTKAVPVADVVFGIDNTFAGVATANGIIDGELVPIDYADVCFNYDKQWFATKGITPPSSWRQLTEPQYKGLTVLENPATSSTGLAFLFSTIAALGEQGWPSWWANLKANGVKVAAGWEDAYYIDFSGSSGHGAYPIVLSYSSSPADEIDDDGLSRTVSLNSECFRQIEYAGVLKNAKNPEGARAFIKFMQGKDFQSALPEANYVYPIVKGIKLPDAWARFAKPADSFVDVSKLDFDANRKAWQKKWADIMAG